MAEAIVSTILEKLTAIEIDKASEAWALVRDVEKEVKRLERNFKAVRLELEDAEERQYLDKSLKHWLDRFKEVAYDMEDVLDDWKAALQEMQTADHGAETSTKWKVCPFVSCFAFGSQVVKRHDIAIRIKDINEELGQIVEDKNNFNLIKRGTIKQPKRPESTSFVYVSDIYGRDEVKEDIIRTLLCGTSEEEGSCIPTMSIVGMGGLGKTALAQLIYNDHRIKTHFNERIWVCVSDPFDKFKIARAILENLDPDSTISPQNTISLQALFSKINKNIEGKKFILVMDDVWINHGQDWEDLKASFQSHMSGSRILVTTRKESVAEHMKSAVIPLDKLSDDICWRILSQNAFTERHEISCENLEGIGRAIAKKCKGLPLTAKTLAGLLQHKFGKEKWQNILDSEIWTSGVADIAREDVFKPLFLSYFDLSPEIRRCLLYCAIFPKDEEIDKDELVQRWMAQGYLGTESEGEKYFNYLATCSFFQDFRKDGNGNIIICKMHDLVHDFVQFLTGLVMKEMHENLTVDLSSKKPRHLRLEFSSRTNLSSISGVEKLRSFASVSRGGFSIITFAALQNLFSQSKHLRLLDFRRFGAELKEFPFDIGKLIHLRYLGFVYCFGINVLPEAVCELPNLQSLNLQHCVNLVELPVGIEKLINLRYLCTKGCNSLTYYPKGISKLTALRRLSNIRMTIDGHDADQFSIGDLEKMDFLGGELCIELTGNKINCDEAKRAKLDNKKHLKRMMIQICSPNLKEEEVKRALNPPSNLHVVLRTRIEGKISISLIVQKKALQFIEAVGAIGSGENKSFYFSV